MSPRKRRSRGFFARFREAVASLFTSKPTPPTDPFTSEPDNDFRPNETGQDNDDLPPGWTIAGLYTLSGGMEYVNDSDVTDKDVMRSNAIVVKYQGQDGMTIHRTVHGAESRRGLGDVIRFTVMNVSPVGSSRGDR